MAYVVIILFGLTQSTVHYPFWFSGSTQGEFQIACEQASFEAEAYYNAIGFNAQTSHCVMGN